MNRLLRMSHGNRMAWPWQASASATGEQSLSDVRMLVSAHRHFRVLNCRFETAFRQLQKDIARAKRLTDGFTSIA